MFRYVTNSTENFFDTLLRNRCVALVYVLQQMYYSVEQPGTKKIELFATVVKTEKQLTIITKYSI